MSFEEPVPWHLKEGQSAAHHLLALDARLVSGTPQTIDRGRKNLRMTHTPRLSHYTDPKISIPHPITENTDLKKAFVDCLAELLARNTRAGLVSTDMLVERNGKATVFATRNEDFDPVDHDFKTEFCSFLTSISERQFIFDSFFH